MAALFFGTLSSTLYSAPPAASPAPTAIRVEIPATANATNPIKIARVTAGQQITIRMGRVRWNGGGTRADDSTNWRGHQDRIQKNSLPWMALVLAVNKQTILPTEKEFTFFAPTDGELVAFANDIKPEDNTGKGEATITIRNK